MRLIDADELDWWYKGRQIRRVLDEAPTIDAVPVVRCNECKHWEEIKHGQGWCTGFAPSDVFSDFDDFCSNGKQKDGDG